MMMKKYASLLFALVLALSLSVSAAADSSGVYVYDDAGPAHPGGVRYAQRGG